jgi:hypothetical protein
MPPETSNKSGDINCQHQFPTNIIEKSLMQLEGIFCQLCNMSAIEAKIHFDNARYVSDAAYQEDEEEDGAV